ncbi:MAG TPA: cytochrome c3 family protein [Pseudobdellovibrionaceae bacterium]|nr:cytochrome c3 family protein [Pseudobdellovibrionaceae bacterium]
MSLKKQKFIFITILLVSILGCDIEQPRVESLFASAAFKHTGTETTCLSCHASQVPAAVNSFAHYNNADCISCHYAGMKWTDHDFHSRNSNPSTCTACHEKDRKAPVSGTPHGSGGDCVSCHSVATNWAVGSSPHNPTPTTCTSCHVNDKPAAVNGLPHYDGEDCVTCHVAGGLWAAYKLYGHTPISATCSQCHENERPALSNHPSQNNAAVTDKRHYVVKDCSTCHKTPTTSRVFNFVHTNSANSKISFCLPCHYTKGWSKHGSKNPSYFTGDGTCYNCHNKGKSWGQ